MASIQEYTNSSPVEPKMGGGQLHGDSYTPRKLSEDIHSASSYRPFFHPHSPPESVSSSPRVKPERTFSIASTTEYSSPLPRIASLAHSASSSSIRLPSLEEFDQGVEAIARANGKSGSWTPPSPLPSLTRSSSSSSFRLPALSTRSYSPPTPYSAYTPNDTYMHQSSMQDSYPSPPPELGENRHINQKYTTEEGDFIIYAWHDKKLKWQRIKQDFASMFGRTPERTVQGLQAWYYRMNQRIPVWDKDGWLIFENDEDLEPKHVSIKCRERDGQDKPMEPLGLAQRYPERAVHYTWVDPELKHKARDWAGKRAMQYRDRRDRRRRKEQRRLKL